MRCVSRSRERLRSVLHKYFGRIPNTSRLHPRKLLQHAPELLDLMHEKDKRRHHERELLEVMHVQRGQADLTSVRAGMALVSEYAEPLPEQGRPR